MYFGDEDTSTDASDITIDESENEINVVVMSEAGKPIYARRGDDPQVARICALVQAIRMSLMDPRMHLGDIQSLTSENLKLVFMTVHSITLMAVAKRGRRYGECSTEAYLRLQLEHVYGQILLTLTEQVQTMFLQNPNFDLGESLGASTSLITPILDEAGESSCGSFLAAGVESVFHIAPEVRENMSQVLFSIGEQVENTVFALLVTGKKLLSIVQPRHVPHQLSAFDLRLLIHFVVTRPGLLTSELWFPVCLPRFNSNGFLYTYTNCLDSSTKLTLILVSQSNTTEQFQLFRNAALAARENLGLPQVIDSVLRIVEPEPGAESVDDIAWRRSHDTAEEDYVDASLDGNGEMIPYVFKDSPPPTMKSASQLRRSILLEELEKALNPDVTANILNECCEIANAKHFLFRLDAPVQTDKSQAGKVTQCLSSSLDVHFPDEAGRHRVQSMYQKLQLRMRLGSATCEATMDAFDMISQSSSCV